MTNEQMLELIVMYALRSYGDWKALAPYDCNPIPTELEATAITQMYKNKGFTTWEDWPIDSDESFFDGLDKIYADCDKERVK